MPDERGPETLTITLTGRAPVRVVKSEWPIVAEASEHDGAIPSEANRRWHLTVRRHADGRHIVYGRYSTVLQGEHDARRGVLVAGGHDVAAAVHSVAEQMAAAVAVDGTAGGDDAYWYGLAEECIADLPAEVL